MKQLFPLLVVVLFILSGCGQSKQTADDIITVDVTKSYPKKELILQDIFDVEYIPLETTDEFLTQAMIIAVGKNHIITRNHSLTDSDLFVFDRKGKGVKKIDRKGQGGEEYAFVNRLVLDEENNEMFIIDQWTGGRILVYDLEANFKRSFMQKKGKVYSNMGNFGKDHLIVFDDHYIFSKTGSEQPFIIISKQDGNITKEIHIPFEEKILATVFTHDEESDLTYPSAPIFYDPIKPYYDNWILTETSSDTIYSYSPDHTMTPLIARTPPIQSMKTEIFLFPSAFTDRYYFMQTIKKEYDIYASEGFPSVDLVYDKQERAIYESTVYNGDYTNKQIVPMMYPSRYKDVTSVYVLEAVDLIDAYEEGRLKGHLKEIAATLDEEDNAVLMLLKQKK